MFFHFFKKNIIKTNDNSYTDEKSSDFIDIKINLDVSKEIIIYNLDWYCCHKELTGLCSLFLDKPLKQYSEKYGYFNNYDYCKNLANNIKINGVIFPIWIFKDKNGFCFISDGQHRACICQKLNLKVPAYFSIPKSIIKNYEEYIIDSFL